MRTHLHLAILTCIFITFWRSIKMDHTIFGGAGEVSELHCLASEDILMGNATVAWRRLSGNESEALASLSVQGWERGGGAWVLVRDGPLSLLIQNVNRSDSGTYRCVGENGWTEARSIHVSEQDCSDNLDRRNVSSKTLETQHDHGLPPLCLCPGQTALLSCGLNATPPFSWERLGGDGTSRRIVDIVEIPQGVGISLQERPSLIILNLQSRDTGIYECQVNSSFSQMYLTIRPSGHFWSFIPTWILITSATVCVCLYVVLVAIGFAIRHRMDEADHRSRMAKLLSSFFRRSKHVETLSVSLNRVFEKPPNQSDSLRRSSGSTWYENIRSTAASPEHEATEGDRDTGADDAICYENLDQQNSDVEAGSLTSEDYLEPIPEEGAHVTTEIQVHEEVDETSFDESEPHCPTDSQVYVPMSGPKDRKMDDKSESSDDYEKMESSGNSDTTEAETEMTREELQRMERCRILFQRKFKTIQANRTTMADAVLALRDPS